MTFIVFKAPIKTFRHNIELDGWVEVLLQDQGVIKNTLKIF